jgi:hypothetical protein
MKRPKGHPDGPTPANSPQKKRVRATVQDVPDLPSPRLLFPSAATKSPSPENDVFGTKAPNGPRESGSMAGTLFSFWQCESIEEKTERDYRDLEELRKTREQRKLAEDRMVAMRKDRRRALDRERQQVHRDKVRDLKVANGWKPGQKRVSDCHCHSRITNLLFRNIWNSLMRRQLLERVLLQSSHALAGNIRKTAR